MSGCEGHEVNACSREPLGVLLCGSLQVFGTVWMPQLGSMAAGSPVTIAIVNRSTGNAIATWHWGFPERLEIQPVVCPCMRFPFWSLTGKGALILHFFAPQRGFSGIPCEEKIPLLLFWIGLVYTSPRPSKRLTRPSSLG